MRLIGNDNVGAAGRVEVFLGGQWGTICDRTWDNKDASVVCKQLGYQGGFAFRATKIYNETTGLIWIRDTYCEGHEDNIFNCRYSLHPSNPSCTHNEDAAVVCWNGKFLFNSHLCLTNSIYL